MYSASSRVQALARVSEAWREEGVPHGFLRSVNSGAGIGRVDVLIPEASVAEAFAIASRELARCGYTTASGAALSDRILIGFADADWASAISLQAMSCVRWHTITLARKPGAVKVRDGIQIDIWASFASRVLVPLLAEGGGAAATLAAEPAVDHVDEQFLLARLSSLVGRRLSVEVLTRWRNPDSRVLDLLADRIRRAGSRTAWLGHPVNAATGLAASVFIRPRRYRRPSAPVIALVGPDGSGKGTVVTRLLGGEQGIFNGIIVRHWRPGILPAIRRWTRMGKRVHPTDLSPAPRRTPGRFQWLRAAYYWIDYMIGGWTLDRRDAALERLVVYDRCALDMTVDPVRFGLSSPLPGRLIWQLSPRPDAIILLRADPELVHLRKPELGADEIRAQYHAWSRLSEAGLPIVTVDASRSPMDVTNDVRRIIAGVCLRQHGFKAATTNATRQAD